MKAAQVELELGRSRTFVGSASSADLLLIVSRWLGAHCTARLRRASKTRPPVMRLGRARPGLRRAASDYCVGELVAIYESIVIRDHYPVGYYTLECLLLCFS